MLRGYFFTTVDTMKKRYWLLFITTLIVAWVLLVYTPQAVQAVSPLPLTSSPADVGLTYESFTLQPADRDLELQGWWMPAKNARATLVFLHGGGSHRDSTFFSSIAFYKAMVSSGVSVAAIDLRNHGESDQDGHGLRFGLSEKWDAAALLDWARARSPHLPLYVMGISMGGATAIHTVADGAQVAGLVLLDPLLDTHSVIVNGAWVQTGLPRGLFHLSAWAAQAFHGMPGGSNGALALASELAVPTLLLQDPQDPVTEAVHARTLADKNPAVRYLELPPTDANTQASLAWRGRWGSHVAGFVLFPRTVKTEILAFMGLDTSGSTRGNSPPGK